MASFVILVLATFLFSVGYYRRSCGKICFNLFPSLSTHRPLQRHSRNDVHIISSHQELTTVPFSCILVTGALLLTCKPSRIWRPAALRDAVQVADIEPFCSKQLPKKHASVYAVYGQDDKVRYVGIARDVQSALKIHLSTQSSSECARAAIEIFDRPSREAMSDVQQRWLAELVPHVPVGNGIASSEKVLWVNPPLTLEQAERKLKLRQATADSTLQQEDPDAWRAVVRKAMKDADDFDGSDADLLDAAIAVDAEASSSPLFRDIAIQQEKSDATGGRPKETQVPRLEMYSGSGCPHCQRMKALLIKLGAEFIEYDVEGELAAFGEEVVRRARHARFNTVPQLYILREPPLHGRQPERLVGGADDLEKELSNRIFQAELHS